MERKNAWEKYNETDLAALEKLSADYRRFLDLGKTERECAQNAIVLAQEAGFRNLDDIIAAGKKLSAGDKVYCCGMGKTLILFHVGTDRIENGMAILGAHIDSPRLDVKPNPLYEDGGFAYLDTHYYGGIKKYQWVTLPMAIHGVIAKKDGSVVNVSVGDSPEDPVFCVTDLLIHLAAEQQEKKAAKVIEGEKLDLTVGNRPLADADKDAVKANVLALLKEKYGVEEEDFLSAELEIVPAGAARDMGLDRSMIMAYGHDDRCCAYPSLLAILQSKTRDKTACCILTDKEEIGSVGATGAQSRFFENTVAELLHAAGEDSPLALRHALSRSNMLSSDVNAGYDPLYAGAFDQRNASYLGDGLVFNKYTGARGKSGANDANAEYLALVRRIMDEANVSFQLAELGKVDQGGGGTIAYILALYGMNVIDCGIAVMNMHAPWEVISKADLYEAVKGYAAFLANA